MTFSTFHSTYSPSTFSTVLPNCRLNRFLAATVVIALAPGAAAQPPTPLDEPATAVWQSLRELANTGSVLQVVAHPDDEDGALLTQLARQEGARAMLFSVTRGEGGANMISSDFFDALGILRTLEHAAAADYYGSEVFYSHAVDYGYSKQLEEALRSWGGVQPVLADLVRVIRRERPDVIAARFRGEPRDGHGHHQFSGVIAQLAFAAAADPERFPEQIAEGLQPWQAAKLYHDNLQEDERDPESAKQLAVIDTSQLHPILKQSYAQIARRGLRLQRSQGMGDVGLGGGPSFAHYRLVESAGTGANQIEASLLEGVDTSIAGLATRCGIENAPAISGRLTRIQSQVNDAVRQFAADQPHRAAPPLIAGLVETQTLRDALTDAEISAEAKRRLGFHVDRLVWEFETGIASALEIELSATCLAADGSSERNHVSPGDAAQVAVRFQHQAEASIEVAIAELGLHAVGASAAASAGAEVSPWKIEAGNFPRQDLPADEDTVATFDVAVPSSAPVTRPYWKRDSLEQNRYELLDPRLAGEPLPPSPLAVEATISINGAPVRIRRPVEVAVAPHDGAPARYPLLVLPRLSVRLTPRRRVVPVGDESFSVQVAVRSLDAQAIDGDVALESTANLQIEPARIPFHLPTTGAETTVEFQVRRNSGDADDARTSVDDQTATIRAVATVGDRAYGESVRLISAPDLSRFPFYEPAALDAKWTDLKLPDDLRVGYVRGTGDEVGAVLESLGVDVDYLDADDLSGGDLDQFDAIVVGVRAYAVRDDLIEHNDRLLQFVRNGGVAVIQYQTPEFDQNFGPYPYVMGRRPEEVSEQDAPVKFLEPDHPLMQQPNRITPADFDGWIEQRGSKFLAEWDDRYAPVLECHDQGQLGQRGGLLYARSGEGAYIYAAYAWYRQLPQGVPGAHRIFANLVSHGRALREE